jgi:hypothetical protein
MRIRIHIPLAAAAAASSTLLAAPVAAQTDYEAVVRSMADCKDVADIAERAACYDKIIDGVDFDAMGPESGSRAPTNRAIDFNDPANFGVESLPSEAAPEQDRLEEISAVIDSIRETRPRFYRIVLEGGATWDTTEGVTTFFKVPKKGDTITIERSAMGGFRIKVPGQTRPIRARRVR